MAVPVCNINVNPSLSTIKQAFLLMILSADSVAPRSLELSLDVNLKTKNIVDVPEMEQFSKAKFSVGKFKPLHICEDKLDKLMYRHAVEAEQRARRMRAYARRRQRSSDFEDEQHSELLSDVLTPNERMLVTNYNCQLEVELGNPQTEECKTIVEFVAANGDLLKDEEKKKKNDSRMVRAIDIRKINQTNQRIQQICCSNTCTKENEDEIRRHLRGRDGKDYRWHIIENYRASMRTSSRG